MVCTFWHKNLWRCSTIELFPSSESHKPSAHFLDGFYWSKVFFGGIKHGIASSTISFHCYKPKIPRVICFHLFSPLKLISQISRSYGQPYFSLKTCPCPENSTTDTEQIALKTTLSRASKVKG